jgi:hypothetical protein
VAGCPTVTLWFAGCVVIAGGAGDCDFEPLHPQHKQIDSSNKIVTQDRIASIRRELALNGGHDANFIGRKPAFVFAQPE